MFYIGDTVRVRSYGEMIDMYGCDDDGYIFRDKDNEVSPDNIDIIESAAGRFGVITWVETDVSADTNYYGVHFFDEDMQMEEEQYIWFDTDLSLFATSSLYSSSSPNLFFNPHRLDCFEHKDDIFDSDGFLKMICGG